MMKTKKRSNLPMTVSTTMVGGGGGGAQCNQEEETLATSLKNSRAASLYPRGVYTVNRETQSTPLLRPE